MIIGIGDANPMHPKNSLQRAVTFTQPTQPLEFRQKARKKPKKKNLKKSRLLRKMGLDFDGDWMSVDQPANADVFTAEVSDEHVAALLGEVDDLKLRRELNKISGGKGINPEALDVFEQWLVQKSACPVQFEWNDLGEYFWPRWIKHGTCQGGGQHAKTSGCSWPQGMNCVQDEVEMLQILRWHCRTRRNQKSKSLRKRKCKWYKVPYPVTSSCKCSCT